MRASEKHAILLEVFNRRRGEAIDCYDEELLERLEIGPRQLCRELEVLARHYDSIVTLRKGRRKAWKLLRPLDILREAFDKESLGLGILFEMAREGMPEILEEWNQTLSGKPGPYLFVNPPYEDLESLEAGGLFEHLKNAIERREYRTIELKGKHRRTFRDVKPIKLIFSEGNWYVAYIDGAELRLSRISFIRAVRYSSRSERYRPASIHPYLHWIGHSFQNGFSRYGITPKRARLRAAPNIAHYFEKGMKRFFRSQRFIETLPDGSVRFSIDYTQPKEILPFVQRWMPDLVIESPDELKGEYRAKLKKALRSSI